MPDSPPKTFCVVDHANKRSDRKADNPNATLANTRRQKAWEALRQRLWPPAEGPGGDEPGPPGHGCTSPR